METAAQDNSWRQVVCGVCLLGAAKHKKVKP